MREFKCPHSVGRFCRSHGDLRSVFPRRCHPHHQIPAGHRRFDNLRHTAAVSSLLEATRSKVLVRSAAGYVGWRGLWQNPSEKSTDVAPEGMQLLIIRSPQMHQLGERQLREFHDQLKDAIRSMNSAHTLDDDVVSQLAQAVMRKADALGAEAEREIALLAEIVFHIGDAFDCDAAYPWIPKLLDQSWLTLFQKLLLIHSKVTPFAAVDN
jgi:hypothetical protein